MEALDHQIAALNEITVRACAFYNGQWRSLAIKPRWHSLLIAPTGTGKTTVATLATKSISEHNGTETKLLRVAAPSWMPTGAHNRGSRETLAVIAEVISTNNKILLVVDEIDKIHHSENPWHGYIRSELFEILDGRWPTGLKLDDDNFANTDIETLTAKLQTNVFVLGIGTFQDWFDSAQSRRSIGFGPEQNAQEEISAEYIANKLPRELTNRFNSELIRLPELQPADYQRIARQAENTLPERLRNAFREETNRRMQDAIQNKKGVRFLEECIMDVLKKNPPEPEQTIATSLNIFDDPAAFEL